MVQHTFLAELEERVRIPSGALKALNIEPERFLRPLFFLAKNNILDILKLL